MESRTGGPAQKAFGGAVPEGLGVDMDSIGNARKFKGLVSTLIVIHRIMCSDQKSYSYQLEGNDFAFIQKALWSCE